MLKVLIVDDEEKVCQLIRGLVPWEALGFHTIGAAHDGLSALEMLKTHKPDIMITDIRMPGMDGISLIREAKALLPDLRCIIISGYRHFDYAHNAIKYGVEDYLLKPLQKQEMIDTLTKLRAQRASPEAGDEAGVWAFLNDCLQGSKNKALTKEKMREQYHMEIPEGGLFFALMVKPDLSGVPAGDTIGRIASERIMDTCRSMLSPLLQGLWMALLPEGIALLLCIEPEQEKRLFEALHSIRDRAEMMRDLFPTLRVSIGISESSWQVEDIPGLFLQSYAALETRLLQEEGTLFFGKKSRQEELYLQEILRADTLRGLSSAIHSLQAGAYREGLQSALDQIRSAANGNMPLFRATLKEMIHMHFEQIPHGTTLKEMEALIAKFLDQWNASVSLSEVEEGFLSLLTQHLLDVDAAHRQVEQMPLRRAKAYIRENFQRPLTLEEVSGVAGFNPAYFSSLFKKETGEKFTDYLASVRVSVARKLLTDGDLPIAMVAEKTGYGDVKYFGKQFKKATGLSPQEYRKLYG